MVECLLAGGADGATGEGCRGHRGVVDHTVDDHVDDVGVDGDRVGGDLGDVPRELAFALEVLVAAVDAEVVLDGHAAPCWSVVGRVATGREASRPSSDSRMFVRALWRWT